MIIRVSILFEHEDDLEPRKVRQMFARELAYAVASLDCDPVLKDTLRAMVPNADDCV